MYFSLFAELRLLRLGNAYYTSICTIPLRSIVLRLRLLFAHTAKHKGPLMLAWLYLSTSPLEPHFRLTVHPLSPC